MNLCEWQVNDVEPCDEPATIKHRGGWLCETHYDMLMDWELVSDPDFSPGGYETES